MDQDNIAKLEEQLKIRENVPIAELTTMRLGGNARYVVTITEPGEIDLACQYAKAKGLPIWVMGGGANTIGHDGGFDGVILLNEMKGIFAQIDDDFVTIDQLDTSKLESQDELILTGMSGEIWDDFVKVACDLGYSGMEAMSSIPGTLGAAPVQNIGAYGQEIAGVIRSVETYDLQTGKLITFEKPAMAMGYRHTRFNYGPDAGRYMILSVTVALQKTTLQPPFYNSLQRYIDEHQETDFSPANIRRMVCEIRNEKLPDPKFVASAGSFFKNVYIEADKIAEATAKGIPVWQNDDGSGKINSGWLIEACGFKGKVLHGFKVSEKATLVLINESATSHADLAACRQEITQAVYEKFGYQLEQEPVELGNE